MPLVREPKPSRNGIGVVIPSYRVTRHILDVIRRIGPEVDRIYVVDDKCPDRTGDLVVAECQDPRVVVLRHDSNQGVGGAVMSGYRAAVADDVGVIVKIDGDGQMDPALVSQFARPIQEGWADYTKGNRFFDLNGVQAMPAVRLFGNAVLSVLTKLSTGYWTIFDPTNGYTAIDGRVAAVLPYDKISRRYFFESDILFRLNTLRCVVVDIPMTAVYGDEVSHLKVSRVVGEFLVKHLRNFGKRIFYNYVLRDMTVATFELLLGALLLVWGVGFGSWQWLHAAFLGQATPLGTIMLAVLPIVLGVQFLLAFINYDVMNVPVRAVGAYLAPPVSLHRNNARDPSGCVGAHAVVPRDASESVVCSGMTGERMYPVGGGPAS